MFRLVDAQLALCVNGTRRTSWRYWKWCRRNWCRLCRWHWRRRDGRWIGCLPRGWRSCDCRWRRKPNRRRRCCDSYTTKSKVQIMRMQMFTGGLHPHVTVSLQLDRSTQTGIVFRQHTQPNKSHCKPDEHFEPLIQITQASTTRDGNVCVLTCSKQTRMKTKNRII
jgi:hypothetical protein